MTDLLKFILISAFIRMSARKHHALAHGMEILSTEVLASWYYHKTGQLLEPSAGWRTLYSLPPQSRYPLVLLTLHIIHPLIIIPVNASN